MPPSVLDLPPRRKIARSFYRRWTWRRQLVATGIRLVVLACLALLVLGGWYLANKGFGRQWRTTVADELRKRGVEASVRRLTLDPFRGLVAQDVRIYDSTGRDQPPLAVISELSLDINYAALLHRQPFLNAIDIRNANVTFPAPAGAAPGPRARLQNFRAHVYFPPGQIYISQAEGVFAGVRLSATGQLINQSPAPARVVTPEEWQQRWRILHRLATELNAIRAAGALPSLQATFAGDLSQIENARVEVVLRGARLTRGSYEIANIEAMVEWAAGRLLLNKLEWTDRSGTLSSRAQWDLADGKGDFQLRSTVRINDALEAFGAGKYLREVSFVQPPQVDLSGSFHLAPGRPAQFRAVGHLALGDFVYKTIPFLGLSADGSWDGTRLMLRDVRVRHASGEVLADVLDTPGDFRLKLESSINPAALRALAPEGLRKFLSEWEWTRSPALRLDLHGSSRHPDTWVGEGTLTLARTRFRGVWMDSLSADLRLSEKAITFDDLRVARDAGRGTGSFTYDYGHHEVRLRDVRATLQPTDAIYWIEPKLHKVVAPYKFRGAPSLVANGVVQYRGGKNTQLEIKVEAPAGLDYDFLGKTLPITRARGDILITDDRVQLLTVEGTLFDGTVRGTADIATAKDNKAYSASVALNGVDFPRLTDLYFKYETARGQLSGSYDFKGVGDDARTMRGAGKIRISNGNVFAIPVLGPLSGLVAEIVPGAGYSVAKEATASFTIKEGVIHTDDFKVSGKLFGMVGHGDLFFLENKIDFDLRISASGPGIVLTPVYKLFEYKGDGSLSKPNWHPKRF